MTKRLVETTPTSREAILDAAERIMTTAGYDKASVALICRESGMTVGSLYHHFGSKSGLLAEVIQRLETPFFTSLPRSVEGVTDPIARLDVFWSSAIDGMISNYGFFKLSSELLVLSREDPELRALMARQDRSSQATITDALGLLARLEADENTLRELRDVSRIIITFTRGAVMSSVDDHLLLRREMENFLPVLRAVIAEIFGTRTETG